MHDVRVELSEWTVTPSLCTYSLRTPVENSDLQGCGEDAEC